MRYPNTLRATYGNGGTVFVLYVVSLSCICLPVPRPPLLASHDERNESQSSETPLASMKHFAGFAPSVALGHIRTLAFSEQILW